MKENVSPRNIAEVIIITFTLDLKKSFFVVFDKKDLLYSAKKKHQSK